MITKVTGIELIDSRGVPAVCARVDFENGIYAYASVPSGASVGSHEAKELRDNDARFGGKGVSQAVDVYKRQPLLSVWLLSVYDAPLPIALLLSHSFGGRF